MHTFQGSDLRDIILNIRTPIVLRNFSLNWKCFGCPIDEWCTKFDSAKTNQAVFEFEQMPVEFGDCPQWERYRAKIKTSLTEFLNVHSKNVKHWTAFNYKQVKEIPVECRYDIDYSRFGFSQAAQDASFWLSSKGANTPCHYDTYGCNIVSQIYGRKQWLLFPPKTQLTPTRVPYEESSVYCAENFFSPKSLQTLSVASENAFQCILEEGDVLIVPRNWWHYVETLETSLSVNAWIPLEIDIDAQIEECIVKYIIEKSLNGESDEMKQYILNPNQLELITSSEELFRILRYLSDNTLLSGKVQEKSGKYPYEYLSEEEVNELIAKSEYNVSVLKPLHPSEFENVIYAKTRRYVAMQLPDSHKIDPMHTTLLNAICHPNVIKVIKENFLKTYSSCI